MNFDCINARVLVIGSGAAGLAAAVRLHAAGVEDVVVCTESLKGGTSINTGSDKQTYYKLNLDGSAADSAQIMAEDLAACGAVHGDIALVEAALSAPAFSYLASLGVKFPHDEFGRFAGYRTDHDTRGRATSAGPYTSRDMCRCLIAEVKRRGIRILENLVAAELLVKDGRAFGAVFVNRAQSPEPQAQSPEPRAQSPEPEQNSALCPPHSALDLSSAFTAVIAPDVIFAVGGPGGLYGRSVYPSCHTGAIGLALLAGAKARNLAESQFGMASVKFRWNVSGSYMQVVPRVFSRDDSGHEYEFLADKLGSPIAACNAVFQKGYHWPFSAGEVHRSSLVDILVYIETVILGRHVFLDYTRNPSGYSFAELSPEARDYLEKCGADKGATPAGRLSIMNPAAIELYRDHSIDICSEPLEIAICCQHNNGGLAADKWWESENIRHLFPVGEVNGSHGIVRPGGTALNAGQVGAWRAAETIAARPCENIDFDAEAVAASVVDNLVSIASCIRNWRNDRSQLQERMDRAGGFIRKQNEVDAALGEAKSSYLKYTGTESFRSPRTFTSVRERIELAEILQTRQLLFAQCAYLGAISAQIKRSGSRGGSIAVGEGGEPLSELKDEKISIIPENKDAIHEVSVCTVDTSATVKISYEPCRPVPASDLWFENVWRDYKAGKVFQKTE